MKHLTWNEVSELGLIRRINDEILHPVGLSLVRDPDTGISPSVAIADDLKWQYPHPPQVELTDAEIKQKLQSILDSQ